MSAQLLSTELANLIQESKRKHNDLRQAAEKSLEDLKSIRASSETNFAADLSQRVNFANPFIIACGTRNAKFTGISIVCLQRLIVIKALPRSRLNQVLEALREATSAGLDVQLKILQALPSLLQNYSTDVKGDLLVTALNICFTLQSSKNAIVNNTSAATLQQLIVSVFDKVASEDKSSADAAIAGEAPSQDGTVQLKTAALDAYRIFNDLCLLTQSQRPEYLRFTGLSPTFGLELVESVLTNHAVIFSKHPEQAHILRISVMPFIIKSLSGKPNFAMSVRLVRILYTLLRRHLSILPKESGEAMESLTHLLDQDAALWRRSLCMEVFRGIFAEPGLLRRIFMLYDAQEGEKGVLKNLTATFVRISTEKPSVIGLGYQSTIPVANPFSNIGSSTDQAMLEVSGVTGIISGSVGGEDHNTGISSQWSSMRVPCIDQLDKTEPPAIPESYIYSLTLACITSLSEGLAKFVLPLTVPGDRNRKRSAKQAVAADGSSEGPPTPAATVRLERSGSFKKNPVPINPLLLKDHPFHAEVQACASLIDECWPAILATCSTFLYAALDSEYYHSLVRAFQKFAHVAGLLQLSVPRDAFLTTLGKAAVPPNVFTACQNAGLLKPPPTPTPETPNSILSNARGLLSVDSLVSQATSTADKPRQQSLDASSTTLNTRNLLCMRALINLGIALGPTLGPSWRIILETLQQADFVLFATGKAAGRTPTSVRGPDQLADNEANNLLASFSTEVKAVETATSRLFESTTDFPNTAFLDIVNAICDLLEKRPEGQPEPSSRQQSPPATSNTRLTTPSGHNRRVLSISTSALVGSNQEDQFALAKLGDVASINLERLLTYPPDASGWTRLVSELIQTLGSSATAPPVRVRAAETLVRFALEAAAGAASRSEESRGKIQLRVLEALRDAVAHLGVDTRDTSVSTHTTDTEIHKIVLEGLKNILESCGETLASGWDLTFEIIDSIFVSKQPASEAANRPEILTTRSVKLIRPSFNSLQLICSDFLPSLPNACFIHLIDTLYKFCSQDDDLNVALTTVTFFWAIADFLSTKSKSMAITESMGDKMDDEDLASLASDSARAGSGAALWMLLLLRLTSVTSDQRLELRNSAIQTLLRIIHAYGDSLGPEAWSVCIKSVIFRLLSSIEERLRVARGDNSKGSSSSEWDETAVVVVQGVSNLLASYLDVLTAHPAFTALWQNLVAHFATMLDFNSLDISSATFLSLASIISKCGDGPRSSFDTKTLDLAWDLWSQRVPVATGTDGKHGDNQKCLLSWVEALVELYRLIRTNLTVERVRRMLSLLKEAAQKATPASYSSDVEYVTPLQGRILDVLKMLRTDINGVPSAMISQVAEFISLAFSHDTATTGGNAKRTYVAMSKEGMAILQQLVIDHATDADIYTSGAIAAALSALEKPVTLKYDFPVVTRSLAPWRAATSTTLVILEATLPQLRSVNIPRPAFHELWHTIVQFANGIVTADCDKASGTDILADQDFDIVSFHKLRELVIPSLGADAIPEKTRRAYAESLFRTSIIHAPAPAEASVIYDDNPDGAGLAALYKPRNGRTVDPPPTKREKLAYVCLEELFALVSAHDEENATPEITVQPPTPRFPPGPVTHGDPRKTPGQQGGGGAAEKAHDLHVRLARTAAPYLILRAALTLRAYAADQPLRGRMPQALSQRRELGRVLRSLVELRSEPAAIPDTPGVESEARKHLLRLYPLLVGAVRVAGASGDEKLLGLLTGALDVVGGELGVA